jgi:hypothetical protein
VKALLKLLRTEPDADAIAANILRDLNVEDLPDDIGEMLEVEAMRADRHTTLARPKTLARRDERECGVNVRRANAEAMKLAKADPQFVRRPLREWAEKIGCSVGLIPKLPLWQEVMGRTGRGRKGRPKTPRAVSLTDKLLAVAPDPTADDPRETALKGLIAEQKQDYEPSPLEEDADRPARVRVKKKV